MANEFSVTPARAARRLVGKVVRGVPWLRRQMYDSTDYKVLTEAEARAADLTGWMSGVTAWRQNRAYEGMLAQMRAGEPRLDLQIAARAVDAAALERASLLEVGCGNGYFSEILARLCNTELSYTGIDYSEAMIESARRRYPGVDFRRGDATELPVGADACDIVFNGVSLMHILDYQGAIAEAARVAGRACIYHSVPLLERRATTYLRKFAYGAPVVEIVFNRDELYDCLRRNGLAVVQRWTGISYDLAAVLDEPTTSETILAMPEGAAPPMQKDV
jgi:ubiquinone/menaquinone biosynthesis C-methylase UbiE